MNKRLSKSLSEKRVGKGFNGYLCRSLKYLNMIHDAEVASASNITPGAVSARAINLEELPFPGNELHCLIVLEHSLNYRNPKFAAIQTVHFETILDPIQTEFQPQKLWNRNPMNMNCCKVCKSFHISHKAAFPWLNVNLCVDSGRAFSNKLFWLNRCLVAAGHVRMKLLFNSTPCTLDIGEW